MSQPCTECGFPMDTPERAHAFIHQQFEALIEHRKALRESTDYAEECTDLLRRVRAWHDDQGLDGEPWPLSWLREADELLAKTSHEIGTGNETGAVTAAPGIADSTPLPRASELKKVGTREESTTDRGEPLYSEAVAAELSRISGNTYDDIKKVLHAYGAEVGFVSLVAGLAHRAANAALRDKANPVLAVGQIHTAAQALSDIAKLTVLGRSELEMQVYGKAAFALAEMATAERCHSQVRRSDGASDITAERQRQMEKEGWHEGHDDDHDDASMCQAAECYITHAIYGIQGKPYAPVLRKDGAPMSWPWRAADYKPKEPRRDLVRAGALIAAEIDRLDRAERIDRIANRRTAQCHPQEPKT